MHSRSAFASRFKASDTSSLFPVPSSLFPITSAYARPRTPFASATRLRRVKRRVDARLEGRGPTQSPAADQISQTTFAVPRCAVSAFGLSQMLRDTKAGLPPTRKNTKTACCGITTSSRLVRWAGAVRVSSCPATAGFVSDDATTPEGFGMSVRLKG